MFSRSWIFAFWDAKAARLYGAVTGIWASDCLLLDRKEVLRSGYRGHSTDPGYSGISRLQWGAPVRVG
jgi:hypothetical protein